MNKFLHQYSINQYLLIILLLGTFNVLAAPFITTWQPTFSGPGTYTVTIPTVPGTIYNYSIDWDNDGIIDEFNVTGDATHSYALPGPRTIRIDGLFPRIYINDGPEKDKILSVEQWGTIAWSSMEHAFNGASNLVINAPDTPNLTSVTSLYRMFRNASNLGNGTGNWNWATNNIQNMTGMFIGASNFNKDISNWDTSNVISLQNMFTDAVSFDQDLSLWNYEALLHSLLGFISNTAMSTTNYDKLLIELDAQNLFPGKNMASNGIYYCSQAAQDARASIIANDSWTITDAGLAPACDGSLTTTHFVITFDTSIAGSTGPNSFNIPTTGSGYNYNIDSNNSGIFDITGRTGDTQLNYGTPGIKTIRIAGDFPRIYFNESGDKDKILSIEQWGTIAWTSMNNAFSGASNLVINTTDTPNLSNVTSLFSMFKNAGSIGNGTGNWDWDTSNITGMANMFQNAVSFDKDISSWNIENVTNVGAMFAGATLSNANYDALLISWDAQNVNPALLFNAGNSQYCSQAAQDARENLNATDGWTINDGGLDPACSVASDHFVITFDTSIAGSTGPNSFNIPTTGSGYNYSIDSNNNGTFNIIGRTGDTQLNYVTPGIKTIRIAGDFPRIYFNNSGDKDKILSVEQWGTIAWSSMINAFNGASNLVINATDTPNLSNVTSLFSMFQNATSIGNGTGNWNWATNNVQYMTLMFLGASSFNKDISNWDTSNVIVMESMFADAVSFDQDLSLWNYEALTSSLLSFISNTAMSTTNYDKLLIALDAQNLSPGKNMTSNGVYFCSQAAQDARASIIANDGWTINDAGLDPACIDEVIFADGFEDVIIVKSANQQANYDFSNVIIDELTQTPKLIIVGLDNTGAENMQIHIRNDLGVLQVRVSYLMGEQWQAQPWQDVDNNKIITLQW